jgi:NADPH-dependent 2,4-dienoyl-CoA reductase/sulfur reductase-like enzyme
MEEALELCGSYVLKTDQTVDGITLWELYMSLLKAESGDEQAILLCAACHQGCLAELRKGHGTACVFNPFAGREAELEVKPVSQPRNVMVVGGGPAGLEAATIAAQRGHNVNLYEQEAHLGGQFHLAAKAPHKEEFNAILDNLVLMAERSGVAVHLRTPITAAMIAESRPEAVILATGGIPLVIHFPGLESVPWLLASDLLEGDAQIKTETAFIIGGGLVGLETADFLASQGCKVELVEMLADVGGDMDPLAKAVLLKRLKQRGVAIHTSAKVMRLTSSAAIVQSGEQESSFPIETVVIAVGVRPNRELPDALADSDLEVHVIGDAVEPRKLINAIWEGFEAGNTV